MKRFPLNASTCVCVPKLEEVYLFEGLISFNHENNNFYFYKFSNSNVLIPKINITH